MPSGQVFQEGVWIRANYELPGVAGSRKTDRQYCKVEKNVPEKILRTKL